MLLNPSSSFAPIQTLYSFSMSLRDAFLNDTIHLSETEAQHLRSQISIGRTWSAVGIVIEDWRSHLVIKTDERRRYLTGPEETQAIVLAPFLEGPEWAGECRTGEQQIYAPNFDEYEPITLWKRYLSSEREEYLKLQLVEDHLQLAAYKGRFGYVPMPDYTHPAAGNSYLRLSLHPLDLAPYVIKTEPNLGRICEDDPHEVPIPDWKKVYLNNEPNGIEWELHITDLQAFLTAQSEAVYGA